MRWPWLLCVFAEEPIDFFVVQHGANPFDCGPGSIDYPGVRTLEIGCEILKSRTRRHTCHVSKRMHLT